MVKYDFFGFGSEYSDFQKDWQLLLGNGQYCVCQKVDGHASAVALQLQPEPSDVITVEHYYSRYQHHVTLLHHSKSVALVEYLGNFSHVLHVMAIPDQGG